MPTVAGLGMKTILALSIEAERKLRQL